MNHAGENTAAAQLVYEARSWYRDHANGFRNSCKWRAWLKPYFDVDNE